MQPLLGISAIVHLGSRKLSHVHSGIHSIPKYFPFRKQPIIHCFIRIWKAVTFHRLQSSNFSRFFPSKSIWKHLSSDLVLPFLLSFAVNERADPKATWQIYPFQLEVSKQIRQFDPCLILQWCLVYQRFRQSKVMIVQFGSSNIFVIHLFPMLIHCIHLVAKLRKQTFH